MQNEAFNEDQDYSMEVASTGNTMALFSSKVYTNRVLAVVRELIFNARDAHIAAGKLDEPIVVHLPTKDEPWFAVIDNGTGIKPEAVINVYGVFGMSTKDGIIGTGKLGIGAKAPHAYTNIFEVITRVDGVKRTYEMYKEHAHAKPVIRKPVREATDLPNGVEVRVPVKAEDFKRFEEALADALAYFTPLPQILNASTDFAPEIPEVGIEGEGWRLRKHSVTQHYGSRRMSTSVSGKPRAVMAGIAYPIDYAKIHGLTGKPGELLNNNALDIDFAPETLVFNPGREELSYDDEVTVPALKQRAVQVISDMGKIVDKILAPHENLYMALRGYRILNSDEPGRTLISLAGARWRGETINGKFVIPLAKVPDCKFVVTNFEEVYYSSRIKRHEHKYSFKPIEEGDLGNEIMEVPARDKMIILINDVERGAGVRFRDYMNRDKRGLYLVVTGPEAEIETLLGLFDGVQGVVRASELAPPKPEKVKVAAKVVPKMGSHKAGSVSKDGLWNVDIDMDAGGYYVITRLGDPEGVTERTFQDMYTVSHNLGFFDDSKTVVAVVPATVSAAFEKNPKWTVFVDAMRKKAKALLAKPESTTVLGNYRDASLAKYDQQHSALSSLRNLAPSLPEDNMLHGILALLDKRDADAERGIILAKLSETFGFGRPEVEVADPLTGHFAAFYKRYPLIHPVIKGERYWRDPYDEETEAARAEWAAPIAEYVALIDGKDDKGPGTAAKPEPRRARQSWSGKAQPGHRPSRLTRSRARA